ncbi:MAG: hypothetical protein IPK29_17820 [Betaproteobacteria bacterium]|nr:hypothetical protein [Betaproteobacteria bacterium]
MKSLARLLILFIAFVALPLRSLAAVSGGPCAAMHGTERQAAPGAHDSHDHGDAHAHAPAGQSGHAHAAAHAHAAHGHGEEAGTAAGAAGDEDSAAGRCSLCTAHCAGVTFVPIAARTLAIAAPGSDRIDFLGRQPAGYVPDILDRPPQSRAGS